MGNRGGSTLLKLAIRPLESLFVCAYHETEVKDFLKEVVGLLFGLLYNQDFTSTGHQRAYSLRLGKVVAAINSNGIVVTMTQLDRFRWVGFIDVVVKVETNQREVAELFLPKSNKLRSVPG